MAKVYVVNPRPGMDFAEAEYWGTLVPVFEGGNAGALDLRSAYARALELVATSEADDWVLPCGAMPFNLAFTAAMSRRWGTLRVLVFHAVQRRYLPQEVALG